MKSYSNTPKLPSRTFGTREKSNRKSSLEQILQQNKDKASPKKDEVITCNTYTTQMMNKLIVWSEVRQAIGDNITEAIVNQAITNIQAPEIGLKIIINELVKKADEFIRNVNVKKRNEKLKVSSFHKDDLLVLRGLIIKQVIKLIKDNKIKTKTGDDFTLTQIEEKKYKQSQKDIPTLSDHVFLGGSGTGIHSELTTKEGVTGFHRVQGADGYGFIENVPQKTKGLNFDGKTYASSSFPKEMDKDNLEALLLHHYMDEENSPEVLVDGTGSHKKVELRINKPSGSDSGTVYPFIEGTIGG